MIAPAEAVREALLDVFEERYEGVVVYADADDGETVLHEGSVRIKANGWLELPSGRLLSPEAVHHVDRVPTD
ncbi:hypothetical protein [Natronomonas gomsonensis]|uniref:hypothetical protein n=1 Tax=Natronomonas gomsonensis TaxID=1046043 RepID=UPI0015BAA30A|nr:hypothetical protein [Natronomonas gomsonensis]